MKHAYSLFASLSLCAVIGGACTGPLAAQVSESGVPGRLASPRATMRTFLESVNDEELEAAASCFDLSGKQYSSAEKEYGNLSTVQRSQYRICVPLADCLPGRGKREHS